MTVDELDSAPTAHDPDAARAILEAAGATRIRLEEYAPGHWLAASREHGAGVTSDKDEAFDTVQEVAAHLVRSREMRHEAHGETGEAPPASVGGGALGERPAASARDATLDVPQSQAQDQTGTGDEDSLGGGDSVAADDAAESLGDAEAGTAIRRGQVFDESGLEEPGDSDLPFDYEADYSEVGDAAQVEGDDVTAPALEFSAEMLEDESVAPTSDQQQQGQDRVYGTDDIHLVRLAKIGRLAEISREKVADILVAARWSDEQFRAVQNHVVANLDKATGAYTGNDQRTYDRFVELSTAQSRVKNVNDYCDQRQGELEQQAALLKDAEQRDAARVAIVEFDPEFGWP